MGLKIPNLDKDNFDSLMKESLAKLPAYNDKWTEYNASDPGMTIIELLAWITDVNSYRLNHLGDEHYAAFLKLITGKNENLGLSRKEIKLALLDFGKKLSVPTRAVTLADFEYFALNTPKDYLDQAKKNINDSDIKLARTKAIVDKDTNKVCVLVIPHSKELAPQPSNRTRAVVRKYLKEKKLLTTRVTMIDKVKYIPIYIKLKIQTRYADPLILKSTIHSLLDDFLHPLYGGENGTGWAFGEDVHISHIYRLLKDLKGLEKVDYIYFDYSVGMGQDEKFYSNELKVPIEKDALPRSGSHSVYVESIKVLGICDE